MVFICSGHSQLKDRAHFCQIGSVLTGDCNVAGMRMLLGQTAERELQQAEQDSSHRAEPLMTAGNEKHFLS